MRSLGKQIVEFSNGDREEHTVFSDNGNVGFIRKNGKKVMVTRTLENIGSKSLWIVQYG